MKKLISKKKPFYPITNLLKTYLIDYNRWINVPISYDDLLRFQGSTNVYDNNDKDTQITLIESENIDYFNKVSGTNFVASDFRRNIITKGIRLNDLINKRIKVGEVNMHVHRLCDPCKYLQDLLSQKNLVKLHMLLEMLE